MVCDNGVMVLAVLKSDKYAAIICQILDPGGIPISVHDLVNFDKMEC